MVNYLILRHGEAEGNLRGVHQCWIDTNLTPKGIQQAKDIGERINELQSKGEIPPVDAIFCSPLTRCRDTLDLVMERVQSTRPQILYTNGLLEQCMGYLDGMSHAQIDCILAGWHSYRDAHRWEVRAPGGGENYEDVYQRLKPFVNGIESGTTMDGGDNVLIMSHKVVSKMLVGILLDYDKEDIYPIDMPPGSGYYITASKLLVPL